jgi:hypothetical protein
VDDRAGAGCGQAGLGELEVVEEADQQLVAGDARVTEADDVGPLAVEQP